MTTDKKPKRNVPIPHKPTGRRGCEISDLPFDEAKASLDNAFVSNKHPTQPAHAYGAATPYLINMIGQINKERPGQPRKLTEEMILEIEERLYEGWSLTSICQQQHIISYGKLQRWLAEDEELDARISRAAARGMRAIGDAIWDAAQGGPMSGGDVARDDLIIKTAKWLMGKRNRKEFGDEMKVSHTGGGFTIQLPDYCLPGYQAPTVIDGEVIEHKDEENDDDA